MSGAKRPKNSDVRSRRAIVDLLKQEGPRDARGLAERLGVTAMAVRQHLYDMAEQGLVGYEEQARPLGRPVKLWRLTAAADGFFPDGHAELTVGLIQAMKDAFGEPGMERLLAIRSAEQTAAYGKRLSRARSLRGRLKALARIRTEEGYMADVAAEADGSYLLVENHCPICTAAASCTGLCGAELTVFRNVMGEDVEVERTDHILAGTRRCAYRVRPKSVS